MTKLERTAERRALTIGPLKPVSWGAIFGGAILSVAVVLTLGVLAVALGGTSFDAGENTWSLRTEGMAAGVGWVTSGVVAVFFGAMVAARLAGFGRRWEGPLHGVIVWALTTVATFALTTTMIVGVGMHGRHGAMAPALTTGEAMPHLAPHGEPLRHLTEHLPLTAGMLETATLLAHTDAPEQVWHELRRDAEELLRRAVIDRIVEAVAPIESGIDQVSLRVENFAQAKEDLDSGVTRMYWAAKAAVTRGDKPPVIGDADKVNLIETLERELDIDRQAASAHVESWARQLEEAWATAAHGLASASQRLDRPRSLMMRPMHGVTRAAWFTFFYLVLSLVAAGLGGMLGARKHRRRPEPGAAEESTSTEGE